MNDANSGYSLEKIKELMIMYTYWMSNRFDIDISIAGCKEISDKWVSENILNVKN